jgi:hypothetical protein
MDVKDEEKRSKEIRSVQPGVPSFGAAEGGVIRKYGTCQRCGKSTDELYTSSGRSLCFGCYHAYGDPGAGGNRPSRFGQIVTYIKQKLRLIVLKPRIIPADPRPQKKEEQTFDIRGRKMKGSEGETQDGATQKKEATYSDSEAKKEGPQAGAHSRMHGSSADPKEAAEHSTADFSQFKGKTDPKK